MKVKCIHNTRTYIILKNEKRHDKTIQYFSQLKPTLSSAITSVVTKNSSEGRHEDQAVLTMDLCPRIMFEQRLVDSR